MAVSRIVGVLRRWSVPELTRYAWILVRNQLGLANRMQNADRVALERVILPWYASRPNVRSVLFVGCDWYTHHYQEHFPGRVYSTIDPDPWKRRFGSQTHHVAGLQDIGALFAPESLDLIVCNGVYGWGLNERADLETAFDGCLASLRTGGHLLIGWNDLPGRRPVPLASLQSLARFEREAVGPLGGVDHYLANPDNQHTYEFFVKPAAA